MKKFSAILGLLVLVGVGARAQSTPNWTLHYVPSPAEWNSLWGSKADYANLVPIAAIANRAEVSNAGVVATINASQTLPLSQSGQKFIVNGSPTITLPDCAATLPGATASFTFIGGGSALFTVQPPLAGTETNAFMNYPSGQAVNHGTITVGALQSVTVVCDNIENAGQPNYFITDEQGLDLLNNSYGTVHTMDPHFPGELTLSSYDAGYNMLALKNVAPNGYSAITFRDNSGIEHGALGWANPNGVAGGEGSDDYLEVSNFGGTGGNPNLAAPDFWFLQSGVITGQSPAFNQRRHILYGTPAGTFGSTLGFGGWTDDTFDYLGTTILEKLDRQIDSFTLNGTVLGSTGIIPTVSEGTILTGSTAMRGTITEGTTQTSDVITWPVNADGAAAYASAPFCTVTSPSGAAETSYAATTTALTINNASATGDVFTYQCEQ